jgi:hypothetical protein
VFRRLVGGAREGELASDCDPSDASFGSLHYRVQAPPSHRTPADDSEGLADAAAEMPKGDALI